MAQLLKQDIDSILPTVTAAVGFAATQSTVESTDFNSLAINYIDQAGKLSQQGETAASLLVTNHIIDFIYTHDTRCDSATLAKALYTYGMNYCDLGSTDQALLMYQRSLRLAQRCNDRPLMAELYNSIFSIYYQRRDFANNIDLLQSALEINIENNDSAKIRNNYNNLGLVHYELGDYGQALDYMHTAMRYTHPDDNLSQSLILTNIAEIYYKQGKWNTTEQMLERAITLQENADRFNKSSVHTLLNMALVKALLGKRDESAAFQQRATAAMQHLPPSPARADALLQLTETNFILGDSITGLRYLLQYEALNDSITTDSREAQLQQLLVAYDTERVRQNNERLRQSVQIRTFTIYGSCLIAAILLALAIVLLLKIRNDRIKNRMIHEQQQRLRQYEIEEHQRLQKSMTQEIDHKNRQLTSYTIDLAANNEFCIKIKDRLDDAQQEIAAGNSKRANEMIGEAVHELMCHNDNRISNDFRVYFDEVHPDFLNILSARFPNLSKDDLRLCAYLHLGMSTKEIAALSYREVRSIDSSRNRLRKKLGISPEVSLHQFLKTVYDAR